MYTRETLIELIRQPIAVMPDRVGTALITFKLPYAEQLADHLIDNDVVQVVRCKDCKHRYTLQSGHSFCREHFPLGKYDDDFCSYGERKDNERKAD